MDIKPQYLTKYLHLIAVEQIADEYLSNGYSIYKEAKLGRYNADILAKKGNEQIVIEVKSGKISNERKKELAALANYIGALGNYKFKVVIANPPKEKIIEIEDIELIISDAIINDIPDELDELSSHTRVEEVVDVSISSIKIFNDDIFIEGDGVVSVEIQFGSDGDYDRGDGFKTSDNFPFEFDLTLQYFNDKLRVSEINKLNIDTSSYYGEES